MAKRLSDAQPTGPSAKAKSSSVATPDLDALSDRILGRLGDQLQDVSTTLSRVEKRLDTRLDTLEREQDMQKEEVRRLATLAEETSALARASRQTTETLSDKLSAVQSEMEKRPVAGAIPASRPLEERDPAKFVMGSWPELTRKHDLIAYTREILTSLGRLHHVHDLQAPKRGGVCFLWFTEPRLGFQCCSALKEARLPVKAGPGPCMWCRQSLSPEQLEESAPLSRASRKLREHLEQTGRANAEVDVLWRKQCIAVGDSVILKMEHGLPQIQEEVWRKELPGVALPDFSDLGTTNNKQHQQWQPRPFLKVPRLGRPGSAWDAYLQCARLTWSRAHRAGALNYG